MAAEWYVQVMGEVIGPMSSSQLREEARQGRTTRDALVRKGDDCDWFLVDRFKGLFDSAGQPVQRSRPAEGAKVVPGDRKASANGRRRRPLVEEEDDAEEAELVVEDERPPWVKKRYLSSTAVVVLVAGYLLYSWLSATQENIAIQEELQTPNVVEFENIQDELKYYEARMRSLGATSKGLTERLVSTFTIRNPAVLQVPAEEIDEFRRYSETSELELIAKYTEGVTSSVSVELLDEYFVLIREMQLTRDRLDELKFNNPSEYKIKMFIDALKRVETATISHCIALYKLSRNQDSRAVPEG